MKPYKPVIKMNAIKFKRATGLLKENFQTISTKVNLFIQEDKENHPAKKRGRKSSQVSEDN